jgi:hypothetical protein
VSRHGVSGGGSLASLVARRTEHVLEDLDAAHDEDGIHRLRRFRHPPAIVATISDESKLDKVKLLSHSSCMSCGSGALVLAGDRLLGDVDWASLTDEEREWFVGNVGVLRRRAVTRSRPGDGL